MTVLLDVFGKPVDVTKPLVDVDRLGPPTLGISSSGKLLWVIDGTGKLTVVSTSAGSVIPEAKPIQLGAPRGIGMTGYAAVMSSDDRWLALGDASPDVKLVRIGENRVSAPIVAIKTDSRGPDDIPELKFSPSNSWLLSRRTFDSFYSANLSSESFPQTIPDIDLPRSEEERGGIDIVFNSTGDYVAGKAQDQSFYIWRLSDPPRAMAKPPISSSTPAKSGVFCPGSTLALLGTQDGEVFAVDYTSTTPKPRQVGRVASEDIHFRFSPNYPTVFVYDTVRLLAGHCGDELNSITESSTEILGVTGDSNGNLVVVSSGGLSRIGRSFYLLGLSAWKVRWPPIPLPVE